MNLVLAGTNTEYHDYVAKVNKKCKQITGVSDLIGLHGLSIILVGTYLKRQDWLEIKSYLDFAEFTMKRG
jgi:hypothetical protein